MKAVIGVDIGHNAIRMVCLRPLPNGGAAFVGCHSVALNPRLAIGSNEFASTLKSALKDFCGPLRETPQIWTTPKLDRVRIQHLQIPRVNASRLAGAVFWALKREEPFEEADTVVDFEVDQESEAAAGAPLQVTGFLAPREDLEALNRAFSHAGYPLTGIAPPMYGLRNLFRTGSVQTPEAPAVFSHIGLESSRVSILVAGRSVFTRSIPIGLQSLAETLIQELKPPPAAIQASNLLLDFGNGGGGDERSPWTEEAVFNVLRPALERLARQIERTLEYYQTTFKVERVQKVFLAGVIASRSRLTDFIGSQITAELIVMDAFDSPRLQAATELPEDRAERIDFTQAFGLALSATGRTPNLARTYQDRQRERQARQVKAGIFALFIVVAAVCGIFYGWQLLQLRGLQAQQATLTASLEATGPRLDEAMIIAAMEEIQQHQLHLKSVARRYESVALLSELANLTPEYIRLSHVTSQHGGPAASNATGATRNLRIEGVVKGDEGSLDTFLTVFVARLDQSPLIRNVALDNTELVDAEDGLHLTFALNMETGEAPAPAAAPKR